MNDLWRTWGTFYNYPKCCVDAFCEGKTHGSLSFHHPAYGTGFVPCFKCQEQTEDMRYSEFVNWLGRDPKENATYLDSFKKTLKDTYETEFIDVAVETGLDVDEYRDWLKEQILQMEKDYE